jgi:DNA-binding beta-propeller fold protein YncE
MALGAAVPAQAQVMEPLGRRITVSGTVLALTDPDLDRIALYDVSGARPRKIGAFGRTGYRFGEVHGPHGATVDARGRLYVADTFNHRIEVFDVTGLARGHAPRLVSAFGNRGTGIGELRAPYAPVAFSRLAALRGRAFVVDSRNDRIQSFDRDGQPMGTRIGGKGAEEGKLAEPVGAAFDPAGRILYVAEAGNRRVSAFDAASGAFLFAFARDLESPGGIAVDGTGIVYVTDAGARVVRRYARAAGSRFRALPPWGLAGKGAGEWADPQAIAVDARGRVYVVDRSDDRGQIFSAAGAFLGTFGEDVEPTPIAAPSAEAPAALPKTVCSTGARYAVEMLRSPDPIPTGELFDLELQVRDGCRSKRPAEGIQLEVDATMPGHGHGMNTQARIAPLGPGRFLVTGLRFHMPGRWEIDFDVMRGGAVERAQVEVGLE